MSSLCWPDLDVLQEAGAGELERALRDVDMIRRRAEVLAAEIVGIAERSRAFADDGHKSVSAWAKATCNWSNATAIGAVQIAHLLDGVSDARVAAAAAALGVDQMRMLGRAYANPRARDEFPDSAPLLVDLGKRLWFPELNVVVRRWEALADQDGAHRAHDFVHEHRNARLAMVGERVYLDAQGGAIAGTVMDEVFTKFCDAEFHADWEVGLAKHGDQMCAALMERDDRQRRFDALLAVFTAAAESGQAGHLDPVVNIVIDQATFEHHLRKAAGSNAAPLDPKTVNDRRCETVSGHQLDPADVITAAMVGHVRRVVLDSAGVVVDYGRKRRLFSGAARDAVRLGDRWCTWPGCELRSGRCQTDHSQPWTDDGPTRPDNGGAQCSHHNRFKQRGYRTWRDPGGQWHTYRPDGSEIGGVAQPGGP